MKLPPAAAYASSTAKDSASSAVQPKTLPPRASGKTSRSESPTLRRSVMTSSNPRPELSIPVLGIRSHAGNLSSGPGVFGYGGGRRLRLVVGQRGTAYGRQDEVLDQALGVADQRAEDAVAGQGDHPGSQRGGAADELAGAGGVLGAVEDPVEDDDHEVQPQQFG